MPIRKFDVDDYGIICHVWVDNDDVDNTPDIGIRVNDTYADLHNHMKQHLSYYLNNYGYDEETKKMFQAPDLPNFPNDFVVNDCRPMKGKSEPGECRRRCTFIERSHDEDKTSRLARMQAKKGALKHGDFD